MPVALGCDNYSCAETQNIFIAMRMLCLLPAVTSAEPHPVNAAYALKEAGLETILVLSGISVREEIDRFPYRPSRVINSVADLIDEV